MAIDVGIGIGPMSVRGIVAGAVAVGDTFNRADNTTSLGTASDGVAWTQTENWGILTNKGYANNVTPGSRPFRTGSGSANYTLSCDVVVGVDYTEGPGLSFRVQDASNCLVLFLDTATVTRLYKVVAGAFTLLASGTYVDAGTNTVSISTNGTSGDIAVTVNSVSSLTWAGEATFKTSTGVGLYCNGPKAPSNQRWDNLLVV